MWHIVVHGARGVRRENAAEERCVVVGHLADGAGGGQEPVCRLHFGDGDEASVHGGSAVLVLLEVVECVCQLRESVSPVRR